MTKFVSEVFEWRKLVALTELHATTKLVAFALSMHMSASGESCYPGVGRLADETSLSRSTVALHLRALEEAGWIRRDIGGGNRTTRYYAAKPDPSGNRRGVLRQPDRRTSVQDARTLSSEAKASPERVRTPRKRDPLFDALAVACGYDLEAIPRSEAGRIGKAVSELREIGATPEQVRERAELYRQHETFGRVVLTPTSLAANWNQLRGPKEKRREEVEGARRREAEARRLYEEGRP